MSTVERVEISCDVRSCSTTTTEPNWAWLVSDALARRILRELHAQIEDAARAQP